MKVWKLAALALCGGVVLQLASCATDIAYLLIQSLATQLASGLITSLGAAATA